MLALHVSVLKEQEGHCKRGLGKRGLEHVAGCWEGWVGVVKV